ncbi:dihydrolipoamide S-acetyltransferase E2 [Schizosaccharomyces japonicus yFS275]|uniref:Acetyltransferase component of pyruvate dehydrogenase complex n=1 Tax=Schizosaccharomyces japonicus (strain yFS275 / FY16936) TaxID=402676 RepID=B6K1P7_SCHJY|nr:dihydrolipoamide S-acetyltransferase E2 [Schizosaccharomyces japonicus yFS275]EEB07078.1 dihydrolipoamide S-acetyltransferase E2 [Schizosaccharomyces japonicus yFS275]
MLSIKFTRQVRYGAAVARSLLSKRCLTAETNRLLCPLLSNHVRTYATKKYPPHTIINVPALSPTMSEGNIGAYHKAIGDKIEVGDVLCEIETDKAQMDFEQQEEGYLAKIFIESGAQNVPVGVPLCLTVDDPEDVPAFADFKLEDAKPEEAAAAPASSEAPKTEAAEPAKATENAPASSETGAAAGDRIFASPIARKLAAEKNINLADVKASGPNGRVIKSDVLGFQPAEVKQAPAQAQAQAPAAQVAAAAEYDDIPLTNMRKIIASRLSESKNVNPHYYVTVSLNMDKILRLRTALNAMADGRYKLSVNDMIIKATAAALRQVPEANSAWMGDFIRQYKTVDISMAVATATGLLTPVIKGAQALGLSEISQKAKDLGLRARDNKLSPEEYQGGTFTISNLGMFPIEHFTSIINPPQACILAVGTTTETVVPDATSEKGFKIAPIMKCTLSADHRVVDGAIAARFTSALKKVVENPLELLL